MKHTFLLKNIWIITFLVFGNTSLAQGPFAIGTIPAGDSIVVYYDVTINTGIPPTVTYLANQGLITGSNFTNVVTDDPKTGTALDSTKTTLGICFATAWTGAVSTAWEVAGNWSCGVPTATTDVTIPGGAVVIVSSLAHAKSLSASPSASITINTGFDLIIHH